MTETSGFRVRLRVRIGRALTSEEKSLTFVAFGREVTLKSQIRNEPLSKAKWIILSTRGFINEGEAQAFGMRLSSILELAALSSRLGVNVGQNKSTSWVNEAFARSTGLVKDHERIAQNVHGLLILPDDDNTRFPYLSAEIGVTADPNNFISALSELGGDEKNLVAAASNGIRLLNAALMASEPLAQMVLAFSAIEELGQERGWSEAQQALIEQLAGSADISDEASPEEREEVAKAIRTGLFRLSLRQGVLRLLKSLGLDYLRKEWDRLYGIRSGIFHGTALVPDDELAVAAQESLRLCGHIILGVVAKEGGRVPTIAATYFKPMPIDVTLA